MPGKMLQGNFKWIPGSHKAIHLYSYDFCINAAVRKMGTVVPVFDIVGAENKHYASIIPGREVFYFTDLELAKLDVEMWYGLRTV